MKRCIAKLPTMKLSVVKLSKEHLFYYGPPRHHMTARLELA